MSSVEHRFPPVLIGFRQDRDRVRVPADFRLLAARGLRSEAARPQLRCPRRAPAQSHDLAKEDALDDSRRLAARHVPDMFGADAGRPRAALPTRPGPARPTILRTGWPRSSSVASPPDTRFTRPRNQVRFAEESGDEACRPVGRRDRCAGPICTIAPGAHHGDPIGHDQGFFLVVRDIDRGSRPGARACAGSRVAPPCAVAGRVRRGARPSAARRVRSRSRGRGPRAAVARPTARGRRVRRNPSSRTNLRAACDPARDFGARDAPRRQAIGDVLGRRSYAETARSSGRPCRCCACAAVQAGHVAVRRRHAALRRLEIAGTDVEQRRLAGARRARARLRNSPAATSKSVGYSGCDRAEPLGDALEAKRHSSRRLRREARPTASRPMSAPASARPIMIVAATAATGVYSTRISSQIRTGSVFTPGPARKIDEHDLVERGHEGEDAAADDARAESAAA